jgi:hypothetical protein
VLILALALFITSLNIEPAQKTVAYLALAIFVAVFFALALKA